MKHLDGKRVLITGASRGLGKRLAVDFANDGAKVIVNFLNSRAAARAVAEDIRKAGGEAISIQADVSKTGDVAGMFGAIKEQFGGLDILINNAGLSIDRPLLEMTEEDWDPVLAVNLKGSFHCAQFAGRMMAAGGGGRIVNISSGSSISGRVGAANYVCSRAAVNALTKCLALELAPEVTANTVALGFFDSPLVRELFSDEQIADVLSTTPIGRIGQFEEASRLIRFLASDAAPFLNGQTIAIDGGRVMV